MTRKIVFLVLMAAILSGYSVFAKGQGGGGQDGKVVIALSNSFYGNSWRKQMVDTFVEAAEKAKAQGMISDYVVVNGDGTQNTQIAQLNSLILSDVNAICINAASPTALNGVIDQAVKKGILVFTFDSIVTAPGAYKMDYDFVSWGAVGAEYIVKRFNGNANVLVVRGIRGSAPELDYYKGLSEVFGKNPGIKIVAEVDGEADTATTQNAVANVLPSLGKIDAVITHGGSYGAVQAFEAAGMKVPVVIGGNRAEFVKWWIEENARSGYETISLGSEPSIGAIAFWSALHILKGDSIPKEVKLPLVPLTTDKLGLYRDIQPGTVIAQPYDEKWVIENIIK
jgi:ribose transport system substrate-binding protein